MKKKVFSPNSPPYKPSPPRQSLTGEKIQLAKHYGIYEEHIIPDGADYVYIGQDDDGYGDYSSNDIYVTFYKGTPDFVNPNYDKQYKEYEKKLAQYKQDLKEWKILQKEYDEKERADKVARDLAMLKKLKEEYEDT